MANHYLTSRFWPLPPQPHSFRVPAPHALGRAIAVICVQWRAEHSIIVHLDFILICCVCQCLFINNYTSFFFLFSFLFSSSVPSIMCAAHLTPGLSCGHKNAYMRRTPKERCGILCALRSIFFFFCWIEFGTRSSYLFLTHSHSVLILNCEFSERRNCRRCV